MRQNTQEILAGRIQPSQFDTVLPPDARSELQQPRFPRVGIDLPLPPQKPPRTDSARPIGWLLALIAVAAAVVVCAVSWPSQKQRVKARQESADRSREAEQQAAQALKVLRSPSSAPVVQPTPVATPASTPSGVVPVPAPRAMLVKLPSPRSQRFRLPSSYTNPVEIAPSHIDESHTIKMPYGTEVLATLRGFLGSEAQLPRVGYIGDMYVVGDVPWIWIQVPGTSAPTWVDP
jgi:hypothetical protein